ncbi:hypothetical protein AVEN_269045-1 [Araneus ventricosus]|uniref:Uncharacterized protein n=1 Tax=Araneus ventricosus TaxID=182803 RepID=A0A4Y2LCD6_ARAVE|nr:hypothetical protein AVEN_251900-1 [Araneus ventricosus]GBN12429.1 hypothetical protein AVEN_57890-1 [Araneus ventricosus]GBN12512.1 hypothetical protein AVEN_229307-1 [Araneus ventricosus]GBN12527.1 hypothetical protein AVEN_269045-1 [Araneus ventricosus]
MKSTMVLWSVPLIFIQYLKLKKVVAESLEAARRKRAVLSKVSAAREPAQRNGDSDITKSQPRKEPFDSAPPPPSTLTGRATTELVSVGRLTSATA